jgi:parallel beta-helix repeat protein
MLAMIPHVVLYAYAKRFKRKREIRSFMKARHHDSPVWTKIVLIGMMNLLISSFFVSYASSEGQTLTVDIKGSGDYNSIQQAINAANPGDTITVLPGLYYENIVINKTISLIGASSSNTIIDGHGYGNVTKIHADGVQMSRFTLTNSTSNISNISSLNAGCFIIGENISFSECRITNCQYGIYVENTSNALITNCTIFGVSSGIQLITSSNDILVDVNVTDSQLNGITLFKSDNNILLRCIIDHSLGEGVILASSSWNVISHSIFTNNLMCVRIIRSVNNSIHNMIFSNDFISSKTKQAYDACNNSWDNGTAGNYWDDYNGTDNNGDGIGDTPIFIPLVSKDAYPRMNPITFEETSAVSLKVMSLANNAVVHGSILVEGTATAGQQKILEVKIQIDNETEQIANGTTHWQKMVNTSHYADGPHLMKVTAVTEDSQMHSLTLSFTVKNSINNQGKQTPGFSFVLLIVGLLMYVMYRHRK